MEHEHELQTGIKIFFKSEMRFRRTKRMEERNVGTEGRFRHGIKEKSNWKQSFEEEEEEKEEEWIMIQHREPRWDCGSTLPEGVKAEVETF